MDLTLRSSTKKRFINTLINNDLNLVEIEALVTHSKNAMTATNELTNKRRTDGNTHPEKRQKYVTHISCFLLINKNMGF